MQMALCVPLKTLPLLVCDVLVNNWGNAIRKDLEAVVHWVKPISLQDLLNLHPQLAWKWNFSSSSSQSRSKLLCMT